MKGAALKVVRHHKKCSQRTFKFKGSSLKITCQEIVEMITGLTLIWAR